MRTSAVATSAPASRRASASGELAHARRRPISPAVPTHGQGECHMSSPVISMQGCRAHPRRQCRSGQDPARRHASGRPRRDPGAGRTVGIGQVVAADADGRAGDRDLGKCHRTRAGPDRDGRGPAGAVPPRRHGHRLPVLPSDPDHDGDRERRDAAGTRRRRPRLRAGRGGTRRRGPRRPARPLSRAALGRRAAARGAGPRRGRPAEDPARRRADRQSRRRHRRGDHAPALRSARPPRRDAGAGDPCPGDRGALRPGDPSARRHAGDHRRGAE